MTNLNRRSLITGLISFAVTAPAIVRAASLMPVKVMTPIMTLDDYAKLLNKIYANSHFGKFAGNRVWVSYDDCIKIFPISDEKFYI
jgi:hypothetical protein